MRYAVARCLRHRLISFQRCLTQPVHRSGTPRREAACLNRHVRRHRVRPRYLPRFHCLDLFPFPVGLTPYWRAINQPAYCNHPQGDHHEAP